MLKYQMFSSLLFSKHLVNKSHKIDHSLNAGAAALCAARFTTDAG